MDRRRWAGISSEREPESSKQDGADMEPTCKQLALLFGGAD